MTPAAWTFLGISWTIIVLTTLYCFGKLLTSKQQFGEHDQIGE